MNAAPTFEQKKVVSLFAVIGYVGLVLLGLYLLYRLNSLIPPFLVATIIAMILIPEVDRLERRGWKRGAAIAGIYLLFLLAFAVTMIVLVPLISSQMTELLTRHAGSLLHSNAEDVTLLATHWMNQMHIPDMMRAPILNQAQHVPQLLDKGVIWFSANLPALAQNIVWIVIIPIIAFFILMDFHKILGKLLLLVRAERREGILTVVTDVIAVFGSYVRGVLIVMALDIAVIFVVLWLAGLHEYALTLAVTAGILYTIPYFGAVVSTLGIGLVTLATQGLTHALVVTGIMIIIHQVIFDNIVAPRIIGGNVGLHPLLALSALMAGGTLFGIGGTLLAVPIAAAVQVVLVHLFPQLQMDVVAIRRAARVVKATVDKQDEADKPPARKEGDEPALQRAEDTARADAQDPPPVLPAGASETALKN